MKKMYNKPTLKIEEYTLTNVISVSTTFGGGTGEIPGDTNVDFDEFWQ